MKSLLGIILIFVGAIGGCLFLFNIALVPFYTWVQAFNPAILIGWARNVSWIIVGVVSAVLMLAGLQLVEK